LFNANKLFYRAFSCVFGKVGGFVSENVIVELLKNAMLVYGLAL